MPEQISLEWKPEKRKVSELKEFPNNPRKIDKQALENLKQRIAQRGFHDVVKVDTEGFILSGHQRKKALTELGIEEVYVLVPSRPLERSERDAVILESNRNDGEWDIGILRDNFDIDILKNVGFTDKELGIEKVSFTARTKLTHDVVVECKTEAEAERVHAELKAKGYKVADL
jgi:superfamily II DNA/RNA helicase